MFQYQKWLFQKKIVKLQQNKQSNGVNHTLPLLSTCGFNSATCQGSDQIGKVGAHPCPVLWFISDHV